MIDTILAVNDAAGMILLAGSEDVKGGEPLMQMFAMGVGVVAFTASAAYGFSNTSECRENRIGYDDPDMGVDPDIRESRRKKPKPPVRLQPEPGVMRSN